jgi:uncharacterized protein YbjT (DUF2867 family)
VGNRSAMVVGATGLIGKHCVEQLLSANSYEKVIVITRRALPIKNSRLVEHIIDFDKLSEHAAIFNVDDIYCCLGSTMNKAGSKEAFYRIDFTYTHEIAKMAAAARAAQFLLISSIGADAHSSNFYLKVKGEIEAAISKLPFQAVHILRPSLLVGDREEARTGEKIAAGISQLCSFLFLGPLKQYKPIEARVVADVMQQLASSNQRGVHIYNSPQIQASYDQRQLK